MQCLALACALLRMSSATTVLQLADRASPSLHRVQLQQTAEKLPGALSLIELGTLRLCSQSGRTRRKAAAAGVAQGVALLSDDGEAAAAAAPADRRTSVNSVKRAGGRDFATRR